jgi:predicted RecB family nuclease
VPQKEITHRNCSLILLFHLGGFKHQEGIMRNIKMLSASDVSLSISDPFGLWHNHYGDQKLKDPEDEYKLFLKEQGLRIEKELLIQRHTHFTALKNEDFDHAVQSTADLLQKGDLVIYGGALQSEGLGLRARPDVIKIVNGTCIIEEYKLASKLNVNHKIQALVYAYILRKGYNLENETLVVSRNNEEFVIPYTESEIIEAIQYAREILASDNPPYPIYNCPSAWGSLQNKKAKDLQDVTLAWNVGALHAKKLHGMDIHTLKELSNVKPEALVTIKGLGKKKVPQIINSVKAQLSKSIIKVGTWKPIEDTPELELFLDLEGTSELFQDDPEWNCIYLIGLIPRSGGNEKSYLPFLAKKPVDEKSILADFIKFLHGQTHTYRLYHWHHYEKTHLKKACARHGYEEDYETLILPYLVDLCIAAQASYVLPTPGYSIKVVAPYFGFNWSQDSTEVDAMKSAMIWFKQAIHNGSGTDLEKVLKYNEDDCKAMIIVKDGFGMLET